MKGLSIDFIATKLRVDVDQGLAFWVDPSKHHRPLIGESAGCSTLSRNGKRYWVIRINGVGYKRSHIIHAVKTGVWPTAHIDHVDGDSLNDRGANLRECTHTQNMWNVKAKARANGLPPGVRITTSGKYQARISVGKKSICLGSFADSESASAAYVAARNVHFGEFA